MRFLSLLLPAMCLASSAAADNSILYKEIARAANASLLWGPYRPNLYFGIRPRLPKSFMGGLMWARVDEFQNVHNSMFLQWREDCKAGG
jgi:mannosyl-oligosaccharide glucosidase